MGLFWSLLALSFLPRLYGERNIWERGMNWNWQEPVTVTDTYYVTLTETCKETTTVYYPPTTFTEYMCITSYVTIPATTCIPEYVSTSTVTESYASITITETKTTTVSGPPVTVVSGAYALTIVSVSIPSTCPSVRVSTSVVFSTKTLSLCTATSVVTSLEPSVTEIITVTNAGLTSFITEAGETTTVINAGATTTVSESYPVNVTVLPTLVPTNYTTYISGSLTTVFTEVTPQNEFVTTVYSATLFAISTSTTTSNTFGPGKIVGVCFGLFAIGALAAACLLPFLWRRKKSKRTDATQTGGYGAPPPPAPYGPQTYEPIQAGGYGD